MANVIITIKIMPLSPDVNLEALGEKAKELIAGFAGEGDVKITEEPIAFGLKSLNIAFVSSEDKGSTDELENMISRLEGVNSVEVTDVRRAIG